MKCMSLPKEDWDQHINGCFLHSPSNTRKLSPMILGFYTALSHKGYHKCLKVFGWRVPLLGRHLRLFSWDVSSESSMAVRHEKLAEFLAAPSQWD
jgi:hypothetical protein